MKILELEIYCIRGITELKLNLAGKNTVIYGPNGAGKSAVVDALDFLLTGKLSRLLGAGTSGISLSKHGPHVDHDPTDAIVSALIEFPDIKEPVKITRCMLQPTVLKCDRQGEPEVKKKLEEIKDIATRGQHVLTRREILKFITSEGSTRSQQVQDLLHLNNIEDIRKLLVKVENSLMRENEASNRSYTSNIKNLNLEADMESYDEKVLLEFINKNRNILGATNIQDIDLDILRDVTSPSQGGKPLINIDIFNEDINNLKKYISDKTEDVEQNDLKLRLEIEKLIGDKALFRLLRLRELIELGSTLIDEDGNCPLCDMDWTEGELKKYLDQKLSDGQIAEEIHKKIITFSNNLIEIFTNLTLYLKKINEALLKASVDNKAIELWLSETQEFTALLEKPVQHYPNEKYSSEKICSLLIPDSLEVILKQYESQLRQMFPKASPQQTAWDKLIILKVRFKDYLDAKNNLQQTELASRKAKCLSEAFSKAKDDVLNELFDEISSDFSNLYKEIHGSDEEAFKAAITPNGASLELLVDFHGRGEHPPHALHSEGHQDSMGLCLYLSLGDRLLGELFGLVILDDVVMSVDSGHRRELCKVLRSHYKDKQFIITTHDRTWASQLRNEGVVLSKNLIEFYDWQVESGPKVNTNTELWEKIEIDLSKNDVPAAAHRLRRGLEDFLTEICESLEAHVVFKQSGQYTLGDLLPASIGQYKKILKKAKQSAVSWELKDVLDSLNVLESTFNQIVSRSQVEQWAINKNVHYTQWADFSPKDFQPVVEAFQDLELAFKCTICKGIIRLTKADNDLANLTCPCGKVMLNLQLKEK